MYGTYIFSPKILRKLPMLLLVFLLAGRGYTSEKTSFATDYSDLEKARYFFDYNSDTLKAIETLKEFLSKKINSEHRGEAYFLLGRIYESLQQLDSSVHQYQIALNQANLPEAFREYIFVRLSRTDPGALVPIQKRPSRPVPSNWEIKHNDNKGAYYTFLGESQDLGSNQSKLVWWEFDPSDRIIQDSLLYSRSEKVLDIWGSQALVQSSTKLVLKNSLGKRILFSLKENIKGARIIKSAPLRILFWTDQMLYLASGLKVTPISAWPGADCAFQASDTSGYQVFTCADNKFVVFSERQSSSSNMQFDKGKLYLLSPDKSTPSQIISLKNLPKGPTDQKSTKSIEPLTDSEISRMLLSNQILAFSSDTTIYLFSWSELKKQLHKETLDLKSKNMADSYSKTPLIAPRATLKLGLLDAYSVWGGMLVLRTGPDQVGVFSLAQNKFIWTINRAISSMHLLSGGLVLVQARGFVEFFNWQGVSQWIYTLGTTNVQFHSGNNTLAWDFPSHQTLLRTDLFTSWQKHYRRLLTDATGKNLCNEQYKTYAQKLRQQEPSNGIAWLWNYGCMSKSEKNSRAGQNALLQIMRSPQINPIDSLLQQFARNNNAKWVWKMNPGNYFHPSLTLYQEYILYQDNSTQNIYALNEERGQWVKKINFPERMDHRFFSTHKNTLIASAGDKIYRVNFNRSNLNSPIVQINSSLFDAYIEDSTLHLGTWSGWYHELNLSENFKQSFSAKRGETGFYLVKPDKQTPGLFVGLDGNTLQYKYNSSPKQKTSDTLPINATTTLPFRESPHQKFSWKTSLPAGLVSAGQVLFVAYTEGTVVCYNKHTGKVVWTVELNAPLLSLVNLGADYLLAHTNNNKLTTLRKNDGRTLASQSVQLPLIGKPVPDHNSYWITTTLPSLDLYSSKHRLLKRFPLSDQGGTPLLGKNRVYVTTEDGFLFAFSRPLTR